MAASSSSSSSDTSSSSDRDRRRRRDGRGFLAFKLRKSHRPRAKRRRRHRSSHDSSSCTADSYRMDSQTNDCFFATFLREEQAGFQDEIIGSSPNIANEEVPNTPISFQGIVLTSSRSIKRGGNFIIEDDNMLVSGWLNTSLDAIVENEQKHKTFWDRIHVYFHQFKKPNSPERSLISLRSRWTSIQQACNKFCGFFAQIEALHPSGATLQDQIEMAKEMYRDIMKSSFTFDHCWNMLRHQPKWQAHITHNERAKVKKMTLAFDSSFTPNIVHLDEDDSPSLSVYPERPLGKKKEKELARKRKDKEISTSKNSEVFTSMREERKELHDEKMSSLKELIRLKKEKLEVEKIKLENEVMLMSTSELSEEQQVFIRFRRAEIMAKYRLQ